ncbi:MAG: PHP domain-containing protein [Candidatus Shikimatogenerans sp. Ttur]|uniref:DNA polymerase III subunit alpha n=1 Tax=Candidatus Shikimatogenerans sp. Ttur TaxID=3158569 RepID=A0AAU7ZXQ6_9FLAO
MHLHNYTYYSILLSNTKIKNLIKKVYKNNMNAFGVIDRNNMISVYDVYNYLKKFNKKKHVNIKYIIGIELYIYNKNINKNYLHPFISKNKIGYLNLLKICSYAKFINKKNLISKKYIKKYNKGLIALTGNLKSKFNYLIYNQYNLIKIKKEFLW